MSRIRDLTGQRFGHLTVILRHGTHEKRKQSTWKCLCDCGKDKVVLSSHLINGNVSSCGCKTRELRSRSVTRHGLSHTKTYNCWSNIIKRCTYANGADYNGNYEPGNCRWASLKEQANNKRNNRVYEYNGVKLTLAQWSEKTGIPYKRLKSRLVNLGWSVERALTTIENCSRISRKEYGNNRINNRRIKHNDVELTLSQWAEKTGIPFDTLRARIDKLGWSFEKAISKPVRPIKK